MIFRVFSTKSLSGDPSMKQLATYIIIASAHGFNFQLVALDEVSEGAAHKVKQASGTVGYACPECARWSFLENLGDILTIIFIFTPTWGDDPILLLFLSKGLKQPTSVDWCQMPRFFFGGVGWPKVHSHWHHHGGKRGARDLGRQKKI